MSTACVRLGTVDNGAMKRFEKYAAQHQLLQEAAFVVARREGPHVLSRRGLAAELGASDALGRRALGDHVRLPTLVAAECQARRRQARRGRPGLDQLLPGAHEHETDAEIVWLRLLLTYATPPTTPEEPSLAERYQRSVHDRVVPTPPTAPTADRDLAGREADRVALAGYLDEHEADRERLVTRLLDREPDLVPAVRALADGLVLGVCTGRISAQDARRTLVEHLGVLGVDAGTPGDGPSTA